MARCQLCGRLGCRAGTGAGYPTYTHCPGAESGYKNLHMHSALFDPDADLETVL